MTVFVARYNGHFDFIDEQIFNDLADDSLKHMKGVVRSVFDLSEEPSLVGVSSDLLDYMAQVIAFAVIDAQATIFSDELDALYESGQLPVESTEAEMKGIYERLPDRLADVMQQTIE